MANEAWMHFMGAAITGLLAQETEEFRFTHVKELTERAARIADYAYAEHLKRLGGG